MANAIKVKTLKRLSDVSLSVSLEQFAHALSKLSRADLTTLEILMDGDTMKVIQKSLDDAKLGKVKEFRA